MINRREILREAISEARKEEDSAKVVDAMLALARYELAMENFEVADVEAAFAVKILLSVIISNDFTRPMVCERWRGLARASTTPLICSSSRRGQRTPVGTPLLPRSGGINATRARRSRERRQSPVMQPMTTFRR